MKLELSCKRAALKEGWAVLTIAGNLVIVDAFQLRRMIDWLDQVASYLEDPGKYTRPRNWTIPSALNE